MEEFKLERARAPKYTEVLQVKVTEDMAAKLDGYAHDYNVTRSDLIRQSLGAWVRCD